MPAPKADPFAQVLMTGARILNPPLLLQGDEPRKLGADPLGLQEAKKIDFSTPVNVLNPFSLAAKPAIQAAPPVPPEVKSALGTGGIGAVPVALASRGAPAPAPQGPVGPPAPEGPAGPLAEMPQASGGGGGIPVMMSGSGGGGGGAPQMAERDILGPKQRAAVDLARALETERLLQQEQRGEQIAAAEGEAAYTQQRALQAQEAGRMAAEAQRERELQMRQRDFDAAVRDAADFKVDPERLMKRDGAESFMAVLSVGLGAIGGALLGTGQNVGLEILQRRIDRDIDAQKAEYAAKQGRVQGTQNAYAMAMSRFGDERAAEAVARASQREVYAAQLQRLASQSKSAQVQDQAKAAIVALGQQKAQDALQFLKYAPVGGGGGSLASKLPELPADRMLTLPDGSMGIAPDAKTKDRIDQMQEGLAQAQAARDRIAQLRTELKLGTGPMGLGGEVAKLNPFTYQQRQAAQQALNAEQQKLTLGVKGYLAASGGNPGSSEEDLRRLDSMVGDIRGNNPQALRALDNYLQDKAAARDRAIKSANVTPVAAAASMPNQKTGLFENRYVPGPGFVQPTQAPQPKAPPITPFSGKR